MIPKYIKKPIIASSTEPEDINVLWLQMIPSNIDSSILKWFSTKGWKNLTFNIVQSLTNNSEEEVPSVKAINNTIGNINSILDNINGVVI